MHDIVYILKSDINSNSEELKYSLRSVEKNFPYNKIWFAGGKPQNIEPDGFVPIEQKGRNKWEKVRNTIEIICHQQEITNNFWLFNDDFFIMQPIQDCPTAVTGTMYKRIQELMWKNNLSQYAKELFVTKKLLENKKLDTMNYALHIPMLINKQKALETIKTFENSPMFRCCYGNQHNTAEIIMNDVKIYQLNKVPTGKEIYLSTSNDSFTNGEVGKYIKEQFPKRSRYET